MILFGVRTQVLHPPPAVRLLIYHVQSAPLQEETFLTNRLPSCLPFILPKGAGLSLPRSSFFTRSVSLRLLRVQKTLFVITLLQSFPPISYVL